MGRIFIQAMRAELGETLTVAELAELRASSFGGLDHPLYERLLADMQGRIDVGVLACDVVQIEEPTGSWLCVRPWDHERDSRLTRDQPVRCICSSKPHSLRPGETATPQTKTQTVQRITKPQARALFEADPTNWSEGAERWAGVDDTSVVDVATSAIEPESRTINFDDRESCEKVRSILSEAGLSDDKPVKKSVLFKALEGPLHLHGYSKERIGTVFSNLDKKDVKVLGDPRSTYRPSHVVGYFVQFVEASQSQRNQKTDLSLAAAR